MKNFIIENSKIGGKGIFANIDLKKNSQLGVAFTKISDTENEDNDYTRTNLGTFVNHSIDDNLILIKKGNNFAYMTKRNIKKGEELLFNYNNFLWQGKRRFRVKK